MYKCQGSNGEAVNGMHIMIRQGTHEKNLQDLIVIINEFNRSQMSLVSDDRSPADLKQNEHVDYLIQSAISLCLPPFLFILFYYYR